MHISKAFKAIFLIVNHCVAAGTPPSAFIARPRIQRSSKDFEIRVRHLDSQNGPNGLALVARAGESCDRCAKCKKSKIRNPKDCTKCIRCPPGTKPDPLKKLCIKDTQSPDDDKEKKFREKMKEKLDEWKKRKFEEKKEKKKTEWDEKDRKRRDERNQKKGRRIGACLPLVAATVGTAAAIELANGGFSTDLMEGIDMDLLQLFSSDITDEAFDFLPNDESDLTNEDFVQSYLDTANSISVEVETKRTVMGKLAPVDSIENSLGKRDVADTEYHEMDKQQDKRFIQAIIAAFLAIGGLIARVATRAGSAAGRATKYFSKNEVKLSKPGESKFSKSQQLDKAKDVAKNGNWKKCLLGQRASK